MKKIIKFGAVALAVAMFVLCVVLICILLHNNTPAGHTPDDDDDGSVQIPFDLESHLGKYEVDFVLFSTIEILQNEILIENVPYHFELIENFLFVQLPLFSLKIFVDHDLDLVCQLTDNDSGFAIVSICQPVEPNEPTDPSEPEPTDPTEPTDPEPTEPTEPSEPTDPTEPTDPSEPEPTEPDPIDPTEPNEPDPEPTEPTEPEPSEPEPTEPDPVEPTDPNEPDLEPTEPTEPSHPYADLVGNYKSSDGQLIAVFNEGGTLAVHFNGFVAVLYKQGSNFAFEIVDGATKTTYTVNFGTNKLTLYWTEFFMDENGDFTYRTASRMYVK